MDKYQKLTLTSVAIMMVIFAIFVITGAYESTAGLLLLIAAVTVVAVGVFWLVKRERG